MAGRHSAVLFDLDETLCEYRLSYEEILDRAFAAADEEPFFTVPEYHAIADRYDDAVDSQDERRARAFADLAEAAGLDRERGRALAAVYADLRDYSDVVALDGLDETLSALNEDHSIGIVTNGEPAIQDPKLDALGLDERVETVVYAGWETAAKPATEPFDRALADIAVDPEAAVYVGNSVESDVVGANRAGLTSVWVPGEGDDDPDPTVAEQRPDYRVDGLAELRERPWA